jgi:hypothetical protein
MPICPACNHRFGDDILFGKPLNHEMNRYINSKTKEVAIFNESANELSFTNKDTNEVTKWIRETPALPPRIVKENVEKKPIAPNPTPVAATSTEVALQAAGDSLKT